MDIFYITWTDGAAFYKSNIQKYNNSNIRYLFAPIVEGKIFHRKMLRTAVNAEHRNILYTDGCSVPPESYLHVTLIELSFGWLSDD